MRKAAKRTAIRRKRILEALQNNSGKGKTYLEIATELDCSVATIRTDLEALSGERLAKCDDSRRPFKWYSMMRQRIPR